MKNIILKKLATVLNYKILPKLHVKDINIQNGSVRVRIIRPIFQLIQKHMNKMACMF